MLENIGSVLVGKSPVIGDSRRWPEVRGGGLQVTGGRIRLPMVRGGPGDTRTLIGHSVSLDSYSVNLLGNS